MRADERMWELVGTQATEWFAAHRAGELSDAQREAFIDWLRASPAHVQEYLALTGLSEDLKSMAKSFSTATEVLVERARAEPDFVRPAPYSEQPEKPQRLRSWAIAASVVLAAIASIVFAAWHYWDHTAYTTAHAEQRSWRLPDGSTVHLNSASQIKVRFSDKRREVELVQGQVLFQVAKDVRRPFWVHAGDATVKAVGTEFDVYRQPNRTLVSVVEGRVAVFAKEAQDVAELNQPLTQLDAGQQARIDRQSAQVSKKAEDVRKTVAWLQRQIVFDHDPLSVAAAEFNRYTETRIRIADESLQHTEVSGIFSAYDAEAFIRFLEHQPDLRVERTHHEVIVTPNAAP